MNTSKRLSPGRQKLTRDEVASHQRDRILEALESVMGEQGYAHTSVADIIKHAGVSRQTFYELFASKEDCFLAGYARRQDTMLAGMSEVSQAAASPMDALSAQLRTYLSVLAADPKASKLYLIGVYAAGPDAMRRRLVLQQQFVAGVVAVLGVTSESDVFACRAFVAATSSAVTQVLLDDGDGDAVRALYDPLFGLAQRLMPQ